MAWVVRRLRGRRSQQGGYVAILMAVLIPTVFMACSAIAVDTARWYATERDMQSAADAAALAGVPYLPNDMPDASSTAHAVAARNGYTNGTNGATVTVTVGNRPTQLKVIITQVVTNTFGQVVGSPSATLTRTGVADYQGPSPMGSPCNTFGNEPASGGGTSSVKPSGSSISSTETSYCGSNPQFWATVEGPETDKVQGDRYQTLTCSGNDADSCASNQNSEYAPNGYFYDVKVQPAAVNQTVTLQLYDPEYANTGQDCSGLPGSGTYGSTKAVNPYVGKTDQDGRYTSGGSTSNSTSYCTGDSEPGTALHDLMTTSFVLRNETDTDDPMKASRISGCTKQYTGVLAGAVTTSRRGGTSFTAWGDSDWQDALTSTSSSYDVQLAQVFHNWTTLCTFTPTSAGDYYLQVQSDVPSGGTPAANTNSNSPIIYSGNTQVGDGSAHTTTGDGSNSFGMRAIVGSGSDNSTVSISGYNSMAIYANASGASSQFHLIRVLPGAAGNFISFSFFDVGDAAGNGTITVSPPPDATGTIKTTPYPGGCAAVGGYAGSGVTTSTTNCKVSISNTTNNGAVETMTIPVPGDYNCSYSVQSGCWYLVTVAFGGGVSVHDVTTWDAQVVGDPVRLVQ
ncbi:MAG TPA: pilus assembly protein TadG-related protein [Nocardioides sp.]|jgi:Flp pilus assembly protein TadG|uniref:pilus assembly protein TadG-related protein n=1 Tax=Nocardioides sp. TaxID=35761 RepID=UPI002E378445|nr:pilus assembly protein TadG-related protein [Nocardioides sp.]HEX3931027.1 pilus assembly protein TadG-related protein [Nocardioides sp.]